MQRCRPVFIAVVMALVVLPAWTASADGAEASTDPTGAHVVLTRDRSWQEVPARGGSGGHESGGCVRRWEPAVGAVELRPTPFGEYRPVPIQTPRPAPGYSVYHVWCRAPGSDSYLGSVWLRPQQFGVEPRVIAERAVRDLPYPPATVGASPAGRGLTGLESWFWVDGYTTAPVTDTVTEFGLTVDVEAVPASVSWDFGDGTTADGAGLGTAPPARSTVAHTFERRARPAFAVRALIRLDVRWRLRDGPWQRLDPIVRTAVLDYPVVESRAALVPTD